MNKYGLVNILCFFRWAENKPIWASASQAGLNFSTMSWSRCDIPWNDVETHRPQFCENVYRIDPSKHFPFLTDFALQQYQTKGTAAAIVGLFFYKIKTLYFLKCYAWLD